MFMGEREENKTVFYRCTFNILEVNYQVTNHHVPEITQFLGGPEPSHEDLLAAFPGAFLPEIDQKEAERVLLGEEFEPVCCLTYSSPHTQEHRPERKQKGNINVSPCVSIPVSHGEKPLGSPVHGLPMGNRENTQSPKRFQALMKKRMIRFIRENPGCQASSLFHITKSVKVLLPRYARAGLIERSGSPFEYTVTDKGKEYLGYVGRNKV